eukprot:TRINITY_DN515_c0_g1_i1.p1 TRINITY_DN515_c0_g1~~TRINITY_DN515_c0_g1_i1.p1  ORF type:complete len:345 (+),score=46.22 TRINITY_DN515_c0_g1_i1:602-1636(+)
MSTKLAKKKIAPGGGNVEPLKQSSNRWVANRDKDDERSKLLKKVQGILNKISMEKFKKLSERLITLLNDKVTDVNLLKSVVNIIFEKALMEKSFASMYSLLCETIIENKFLVFEFNAKKQTFKRILLNKCQSEFETTKDKKRVLGNIRFIGELYKNGVLREDIVHECLGFLLSQVESPLDDDVESVCNLLETIGAKIDKKGSKIEKYFEKLAVISKNQEVPSRIRFLCLNVLDLRKNNWVKKQSTNIGIKKPNKYQPRSISHQNTNARRDIRQNNESQSDLLTVDRYRYHKNSTRGNNKSRGDKDRGRGERGKSRGDRSRGDKERDRIDNRSKDRRHKKGYDTI